MDMNELIIIMMNLKFDYKKYKYFGFENWYNENISKITQVYNNHKNF